MSEARRKFSLLLCATLAAALPLTLSGCDSPAVLGQPTLAATPAAIVLTVQQISLDSEAEEYLQTVAAPDNLQTWSPEALRAGKIAGVLADADGLLYVYADGTAVSRAEPDAAGNMIARGDSRLALVTCARVGGTVFALDNAEPAELRLVKLSKNSWETLPGTLSPGGEVLLAQFAELRGAPVAVYRLRAASPAPGLAIYENGAWTDLPSPEPAGDRFFAAGSDRGDILLLENGKPQDAGTVAELTLRRFDGKTWSAAAGLPLPEKLRESKCVGLALCLHDGALLAARSDGQGVHLFRADDAAGKNWRPVATPVAGRQNNFTASLVLGLAVVGVFFLFAAFKYVRRRAATEDETYPEAQPGALAAPLDRALAMTVDAAATLPFALGYLAWSLDLDPNSVPEWALVETQGVWFAALLCYMTFCEAKWGQTLGKRVMRIRVRSALGGNLSASQAVLRNLLRFVDFFPVPLLGVQVPYLIAIASVTFTRRRQRLGDLAAATLVRRHVPLRQRQVTLASSSPRRRELLHTAGVKFEIMYPRTDETPRPGLSPAENALRFAREKAEAVAGRLRGTEIVIAADTIVEYQGEIIGKPRDREEAAAILRRLSAGRHMVISAVAIIDRATGQRLAACEHTEVELRALSEAEIAAYVDSGEADGKAGAYAIQERGDRFVRNVYGSLSNVIGMPMELLEKMFDQLDG